MCEQRRVPKVDLGGMALDWESTGLVPCGKRGGCPSVPQWYLRTVPHLTRRHRRSRSPSPTGQKRWSTPTRRWREDGAKLRLDFQHSHRLFPGATRRWWMSPSVGCWSDFGLSSLPGTEAALLGAPAAGHPRPEVAVPQSGKKTFTRRPRASPIPRRQTAGPRAVGRKLLACCRPYCRPTAGGKCRRIGTSKSSRPRQQRWQPAASGGQPAAALGRQDDPGLSFRLARPGSSAVNSSLPLNSVLLPAVGVFARRAATFGGVRPAGT